MGLCEGFPTSIMPDHQGRADYHGTSVNQAARFMDAGVDLDELNNTSSMCCHKGKQLIW